MSVRGALEAIPEMEGLVGRVRQFQCRNVRSKADSRLLGHTEQEITKKVYIRAGETIKPMR